MQELNITNLHIFGSNVTFGRGCIKVKAPNKDLDFSVLEMLAQASLLAEYDSGNDADDDDEDYVEDDAGIYTRTRSKCSAGER